MPACGSRMSCSWKLCYAIDRSCCHSYSGPHQHLYSISIVSCSAVKAAGVLLQYEARTHSRTVPVRNAAFVKQAVGAKLSSSSFFVRCYFHLRSSFQEQKCHLFQHFACLKDRLVYLDADKQPLRIRIPFTALHGTSEMEHSKVAMLRQWYCEALSSHRGIGLCLSI